MSLADSLNPPLPEALDSHEAHDEHDEIVCRCLKVRLSTIATAIDVCGAATIRDLKCSTGAGDGCMSCHARLRQLLQVRVAAETRSVFVS
jgi:NAD(P)H-nitrite reductase large subunit